MPGLPGKQQAGADLGMVQIWIDPWSVWPSCSDHPAEQFPFSISVFNATVTMLGAHCPLELRFDAARIIAGWPDESAENDAWSQCVLGTPAARSFEARIPDTGSWLKRHLQLARESKGNLYQIEKIRDDQSQHLHSWAEIWSDHDHDYLFVSHVGGPSCSSYLEGLLKG